jgi:hypothetical protein
VLRFINTVTYFQRSWRLGVERALPRAFKRPPERPLHPSPLATRSCVSVFMKLSTKAASGRADILVCQSPKAGLESPAHRQAGKLTHIGGAETQVFNLGIWANLGLGALVAFGQILGRRWEVDGEVRRST